MRTSKLDAADVQHEVVGCSVPSTDLKADVAAALAKRNGAQLNVVIVCSHTEPAQENTNAGLALEVEQLKEVQAAVEEAGVGHVFVYGSQTKGQAPLQGGKRRALMSSFTGFGPYTVCGPLCQTQVRWLEGMLGMLILALASCSGLVCLYVLDTPTRFEAPKDLAPQQ
ncbi:hypothetical protein TSOC_004784 [Tetrabaena socialis]|uniref:Uncharacterized protein n=1 Tax=Tetrabaena socialis TaxID=47790 RepID=A0A2J8A7Y9_9CHLO|nr:hypothetical protein TSOC_004784 [Tetrabaena socialis]|eukprot:PNH08631.1 hypothetical protein TSOC_004784 [Tetrabaena socialis]